MIHRSFHVSLLALFLLLAGTAAAGQDSAEQALRDMRQLDRRVASIGHRLAVGNRGLCATRQWLPGLVLHDLSQYGDAYRVAASRAFGLEAGPGVLALAENGPAERAGLRADDILLAIDGAPPPRGADNARNSFAAMERILTALEAGFADGAATLALRRGTTRMEITINGEEGCATRFQLIPSSRLNAYADGRYVQVTTAIGAYVADDDELAAVLAHEFAHNLLRHRARLDAAGIARGFLGNFGRNARLIRETEAEADRLSVYLLDRAGFDPGAAARFWTRFGQRGLNFLGSPTHGGWRARVAAMESEIAAIRRARAAGTLPTPPLLPASPNGG